MSRAVRTTGAAATAAAAAVLVLTGCGAEKTGSRGEGPHPGGVSAEPLCPSGSPRYGADPADGPSPATTAPHSSRTPLPLPTGTLAAKDGVRITGLSGGASGQGRDCANAGISADFTVTNHARTAMTYTVTLGFLSASGGAVDAVQKTVAAVSPGQTAKGTAVLGELPAGAPAVTGVSIEKVRSYPGAEAPSTGGPCPASGVRVHADRGDAAMGLRVVGLHLENCGTRAYSLNGRPALQVLDADHEPVTGVSVVHGDEIATGTGADGTPRPLTLGPGERAFAVLTWRNTTEAGDGLSPVNAPYVRVWAKPGARPVIVTPELDLGTTGRLGVGPWKPEDSGR
ncbi:DUF4232 domain-containing protein [Streptomyces sp. NPDC005728]|uniref:DUF4232 domain-containing protein n=1 Tax=Streptomyces sp. NPDC005728 TaxID=3157054 RepID=UPI0034040029